MPCETVKQIMAQFEYGGLTDAKDKEQLNQVLAQCFVSPPESTKPYFDRIGTENFRLIRTAGQLAGGLALLPMGQWWQGRRVSMTGIASVGIAPEHRGSGAAIALLQLMLKELHANGVPISVLYPATQRLYRKAGYEQSGSSCGWKVSTANIQLRARSLPIYPVEASDRKQFEPLYQQKAQINSGNLDRHVAVWQEILEADSKKPLYAYFVGEKSHPQGYIIFQQNRVKQDAVLDIRDWVALTPAAANSLWTFIADHRSQLTVARWCSGAIDPLTLFLPEQIVKSWFAKYWMLRIVDVRQALQQRGYPTHLQLELHLQIEDDVLGENNGSFILSVAEGKGTVTLGGKAEMKLHIRGLAPLYTGFFSPYQLQLAGYLDATESALAIATQLFGGSSPWMPDFF
jgi:predicted acetyltransferase